MTRGGSARSGLTTVAAVDLGASSGRVMVAGVAHGRLELQEVHRFPNGGVRAGGTLHWDILRLYADVLAGLHAAARDHDLAAFGIDSWAVDFGLLDATGALLGNPVHYRDEHAASAVDQVQARVTASDLYAVTGIQHLPFNTLYQLAAAAGSPQLEAADTLLLVPDLLGYWLTGQRGAERTNASTTQVYDVRTGEWAWQVIERAGIPRRIFPDLREPGTVIGEVQPDVASGSGLPDGLPVIAAGSHDTASAVVAVPARGRHFAYIPSGTWSLVGMELDRPVLTEASRQANFTNETGIDGTVRYLRNVMGLWLLQESVRTWSAGGADVSLAGLLDASRPILAGCAALLRPGGYVAMTVRPWWSAGRLVDLPGALVRVGEEAGLVLYERNVALLAGLRGDRLVPRTSFFALEAVRKARQRGVPRLAIAHEDFLVFKAAPTSLGAAEQGIFRRRGSSGAGDTSRPVAA